ncbi:MAG: hypothetical protein WDN44_02225 [Sphingomonas sp.]
MPVAVVLEHNGHTVRNLDTPAIARDIMTYLFDRDHALAALAEAEPTWGGDYRTRAAAEAQAFQAAQAGAPPPPAPEDAEAAQDSVASAAANAITSNATSSDAAQTGSPGDGD